MTSKQQGGCHCGNGSVSLQLSRSPQDFDLRRCTCSFCTAHGVVIISDPSGLVEVSAQDWDAVTFYRFGTNTADFIICGRCGIFVAAFSQFGSDTRGVTNANCLNDRMAFKWEPVELNFDGEALDARLDRWDKNWTPAVINNP